MGRLLPLVLWAALFAPGSAPRATPPPDAFEFDAGPIPDELWAEMQGTSWRASVVCRGETRACPTRAELSLVRVRHWDLEGRPQMGRLVVARDAVPAFRRLLEGWWRRRFPIVRMEPISAFGGSDGRSMAANNTSAFNCRCTTGGTRLSSHAAGTAIDVNPVQNPYVAGARVLPPAGRAFVDRGAGHPGMLVPGSAALEAAVEAGFDWGGHWRSLKDWQHLELGRSPPER